MDSVERRVIKWLFSGDTGISSKTIAAFMIGETETENRFDFPYDPADFGRCYRLLELIPEFKPRLKEMVSIPKVGPTWKYLAENWEVCEQLYESRNYSGLYELIKQCRNKGEQPNDKP